MGIKEARDNIIELIEDIPIIQEKYLYSFRTAIQCMERRLPKKVYEEYNGYLYCPICGNGLRFHKLGDIQPYCDMCGQRIIK